MVSLSGEGKHRIGHGGNFTKDSTAASVANEKWEQSEKNLDITHRIFG